MSLILVHPLNEIEAEAPDGFAPRGEAVTAAVNAMAAAREQDRNRRIGRFTATWGGWLTAGMMTIVATASLATVIHRPVPRDRLGIALVHDNGVFEAPVLREDLPESRFDVLLVNTAMRYVAERENFSWEGINAAYRIVSEMSASKEQAAYQALIEDHKDPESPFAIYGDKQGGGKADVIAAKATLDPNANNEIVVNFVLRVIMPNTKPQLVHKTARLLWQPAFDIVPIEIQEKDDPAGIQITHYVSSLDAGQGQ